MTTSRSNSSSGDTSAGVMAAAPLLRQPETDHAERHAERHDRQRDEAGDHDPAPRAELIAQTRRAAYRDRRVHSARAPRTRNSNARQNRQITISRHASSDAPLPSKLVRYSA